MSARLTRRMVMEGLDTGTLRALQAGCNRVLSAHRSPVRNKTEVTDLLTEVQSVLERKRPKRQQP